MYVAYKCLTHLNKPSSSSWTMQNKECILIKAKVIMFIVHCIQKYAPNFKVAIYCIHGLFGVGFNFAIWQIFIGLPNLNHATLTCTNKMN